MNNNTETNTANNTTNNTVSSPSPLSFVKDIRGNVLSMADRLELTRKNITFGSKVKFLRDGKHVHDGVVVGLTDTFAQIYKAKPKNGDSSSGDVSPEYAQWFPLVCKDGGVLLV